ncbi:hypothetical protein EV360DRAFT_73077 [Lentinula raphanica]|nr:hypothetical protein EV360DRAFT_73077 [Lentinula raphanica]
MADFLSTQGPNSDGQMSAAGSQNPPVSQSTGLMQAPLSNCPTTSTEDGGHSSNEGRPLLSNTPGNATHSPALPRQGSDLRDPSSAGSASHISSPTPPMGPPPPSSILSNTSLSQLDSTDDRSTATSGNLDDSTAEPSRKKKRSEMGPAERQLARQASANRSKKLGDAIGNLLEEQEALFAKTAEDHNVSAARVKRLANQAPALKPKKKASDYNILFFYKNRELNGDRPSGSKLSSKLIHEAVQKDDELQDIRKDESAMAELRKRYMEDKDDEDVATSDYLYDSLDIASFGLVVRSSLESTAMGSYFGRGPVDEFLRSEYGVGIQVFTQHFETWLLARNAKLSKKMSVTDMAKDLTRLISRGLSEITGIKDISMNYASYEASICMPYHVAVKDWPSSVPWSYPQKLAADDVRTLHTSWTDGKTRWYRLTAAEHRTLVRRLDKDGKLGPKKKRKRKAASASAPADERSDDDDFTQSDSSADNDRRPTKKSKASRASSSKAASKALLASRKTSADSKKRDHGEGSSKRRSKGKKKAAEKKKKKSSKPKKSVRFITDDDDEEEEDHSSDEESDAAFSGSDDE